MIVAVLEKKLSKRLLINMKNLKSLLLNMKKLKSFGKKQLLERKSLKENAFLKSLKKLLQRLILKLRLMNDLLLN
jgi:hypothetical protein